MLTMKRALTSALLLASTAACSADPSEGIKSTAVLQKLALGREEPEGIAPGFNLDGVNSDERDSRSCAKDDFVDADGNVGVDNQLARLLPLIDLAGEGA